jgi:hypothetical protein
MTPALLATMLLLGVGPLCSYAQSVSSTDAVSAPDSPSVTVTVTVPAEADSQPPNTEPAPAIQRREGPISQVGWRSENREAANYDTGVHETGNHETSRFDTNSSEEEWESGLLENLSGFLGLDGSKGPEDLGINANFGFRGALNWGYPIFEQAGLGVQLGTAINYSETAVRVLQSIDGVRDRFQNFTTLGVFQRTNFGLSWAFAHDWLTEHYYQGIDVGQWRAQIGYAFCCSDELGVWGAWRDRSDQGSVDGQSFNLRPISQANLFWKHIWGNDTVTRMWVGLADSHGRFVLVAPGNTPVHHPFVFGAELYVPLTERLAIFGEANFITPNDTGTVTATLGFAFYPGGAYHAVRSRFAPLLPVANNPTFALDLRQ